MWGIISDWIPENIFTSATCFWLLSQCQTLITQGFCSMWLCPVARCEHSCHRNAVRGFGHKKRASDCNLTPITRLCSSASQALVNICRSPQPPFVSGCLFGAHAARAQSVCGQNVRRGAFLLQTNERFTMYREQLGLAGLAGMEGDKSRWLSGPTRMCKRASGAMCSRYPLKNISSRCWVTLT